MQVDFSLAASAASSALTHPLAPRVPGEGEVRVDFPEGNHRFYKKADLEQIDFFKKAEGVSIYDFAGRQDAKALQLVLGLLVEHKSLWELLDNEQWQNPFIIEFIEKAFDDFCPSEKEHSLKQIGKLQLPFITLETAEKTLANYLQGTQKTNSMPKHALQARKIVIAANLMESPQKAARFFEKLVKGAKELADALRTADRLQEKLSDEKVKRYRQEFFFIQMNAYQSLAAGIAQHIFSKMDRVDFDEQVNKNTLRLVNHGEHPNPVVREAALAARAQLDAYIPKIKAALASNGADLSRDDLLQWVDGRKGYLFAYYGLYPADEPQQAEYPFRHPKLQRAQLGYRLDNHSAWDLEEEIRADLTQYHLPLPERLIATKEITKTLSPALIQKRDELLPKIRQWDTLAPEEKTAIKQQLIEINGWEGHGVTPEMFELSQSENVEQQVITGKIKGAWVSISLSTFDLSIWPDSMREPDHVGGYRHILEIYEHFNPPARAVDLTEAVEVVAASEASDAPQQQADAADADSPKGSS